MRINAVKCFSMRFETSIKDRAPVIVTESTYDISDVPILACDCDMLLHT